MILQYEWRIEVKLRKPADKFGTSFGSPSNYIWFHKVQIVLRKHLDRDPVHNNLLNTTYRMQKHRRISSDKILSISMTGD